MIEHQHAYDEVCNDEPWRGHVIPERREGDDGQSIWFVAWREELQMPDGERPRPSRFRSFKWRLQGWRWWWSDLVLEAAYRIRKAWRALRHG